MTNAPTLPVDVISRGVKFAMGVCPQYNNATLTIMTEDDNPVLMIDMQPAALLELCNLVCMSAAQLCFNQARTAH